MSFLLHQLGFLIDGMWTVKGVALVAFLSASSGRIMANWYEKQGNPSDSSNSSNTSQQDSDDDLEDLRDSDSSEEEVSQSDEDDNDSDEEQKLVLVVRSDLKMSKSKVCSQCAKGAIAACQTWIETNPQAAKIYQRHGQPKVTLKAKDEEEILALRRHALELGLVARIVADNSEQGQRAQTHGLQGNGILTVLAIGPGPLSKIDKVTGHLKLY